MSMTMHRALYPHRSALLLLAALASCGFPRPPDIVDGSGGGRDSLAVTLDAPRVRIRTGATATVGVKLTRNGVEGPVAVTVGGFPAGVTADPLTIDVDEDTGTLTFRATSDAKQGDATVTVTASAPTQSHDAALSLFAMGPPGTPDQSFGAGGMAALSRGGGGDAILTQPDGKILIAGVAASAAGIQNVVVARYLQDGSIDRSFAGGMVLLPPPALATRVSMALQPDGKILVASVPGTLSVVNRLNADGGPDHGFGSGGAQTITAGAAQSTDITALAVQPDGGIVIAGSADGLALVARLTPTGMTDSSFHTAGFVAIADIGASARFLAVAVQPDLQIVAAGFGSPAGGKTLTGFARFDSRGRLDSGFHGTGSITVDSCAGDDFVGYASLILQQDGKIVGVGGASTTAGGAGCMVRLTASGAPDLAFSSNGRTLVTSDHSFTAAAILQTDGKTVVVGGVLANGVPSAYVARYRNGTDFDSTFGTLSEVVPLMVQSQFNAVTLDSESRILATGFVAGSPDQMLLCRFWP